MILLDVPDPYIVNYMIVEDNEIMHQPLNKGHIRRELVKISYKLKRRFKSIQKLLQGISGVLNDFKMTTRPLGLLSLENIGLHKPSG